VVIGIIGLLLALLLPVLSRARAAAREAVCLSNLRTIGQGIAQYENRWSELFPMGIPALMSPEDRWPALLMGGVEAGRQVTLCPEADSDARLLPPEMEDPDYLLNSHVGGMGVTFEHTPPHLSPSQVVLVGEKQETAVGWSVYDVSPAEPDPSGSRQWWTTVDLWRHVNGTASAHLYLDLHASTRRIEITPETIHPWLILP
jgi:hypothetical protein